MVLPAVQCFSFEWLVRLLHLENAIRFLAIEICGPAVFFSQCPVALGVWQHTAILFGGRRVRTGP
jgi:hypothetical protein